jgi:hypothetical protein
VPRAPRSLTLARALRNATLFVVSAAATFALFSAQGCGTSAQGIDDCRDIEQARCEAAAACGIVADAAGCKRFYRDHCLHGLATPPPQRADVEACVATIRAAGECAKTDGRTVELEACPDVDAQDATLVCQVVQYPERAYSCSFLTGKPVPAPPPSTGGGGGEGGGNAG